MSAVFSPAVQLCAGRHIVLFVLSFWCRHNRCKAGCRSAQELKCSLKGLAMEPRLEVSQRQLVFGEVATHAWADQNLVLANQGALLPIRFNIPHSPYFHCLPNQGMLRTLHAVHVLLYAFTAQQAV